MKYVVTTSWKENYEFNRGAAALDFAKVCLNHKTDKPEDYKITIEIFEDKEEEDDEDW